MAITPQAGWQQDPNNANGVIPIASAAPTGGTPVPSPYTAVDTGQLNAAGQHISALQGSGIPGSTPASPTIASIYGSESAADTNLDNLTGAYATAAGTPVDEAKIRSDTMARLQTEIDATNQVYQQKLNQAKIAGEGRLGSNAAISARRGLIGSDFGTAANDTVTNANNDIYSGIGAEQAAAIAAIQDKGNTAAQSEIAAKNAVKQQSASDYITFLSQQGTRQESRAQQAASAIVSHGTDLSNLSASDLASIAQSYNVTPAQLQSAYVSAKNTAATTKAALDTSNKALQTPTGVPITDNAYSYDAATGAYKQTQTGTATPDSTLKEYQYAVQNDGFTGSLADWNSQKANQKVGVGISPVDGSTYERTGPGVAGIGSTSPAAPSKAPVSPATPTVPVKGAVSNPLDSLTGSDLAYAQTGLPAQAKFKYPAQIDVATARIQAVMPGWTPANATAQYAFFKNPTTQTFIANSNTALNTINDPTKGIKALSSKVNRSNIVLLANGQLALGRATSDPATATFVQQANILADEVSKLLGSGQGSDFAIQLGQTLVNPSYSQATFNATMDNLDSRVRNKVSEYMQQGGQQSTTSSTATPDLSSLRSKYNY